MKAKWWGWQRNDDADANVHGWQSWQYKCWRWLWNDYSNNNDVDDMPLTMTLRIWGLQYDVDADVNVNSDNVDGDNQRCWHYNDDVMISTRWRLTTTWHHDNDDDDMGTMMNNGYYFDVMPVEYWQPNRQSNGSHANIATQRHQCHQMALSPTSWNIRLLLSSDLI